MASNGHSAFGRLGTLLRRSRDFITQSRQDGRQAAGDVKDLAGSLREEFNRILISHKIRPAEVPIFHSEDEVAEHRNGYSDDVLNEYIIRKATVWLQGLSPQAFTIPPHLYGLLFVLQLVRSKCGHPLRVVDFGGGAPTVPVLVSKMGLTDMVQNYLIVENPSFIAHLPESWRAYATYTNSLDGGGDDILILSSVLPYISRRQADEIFDAIRANPPAYIYFGRTAFLPESYPSDEAFTIQSSRFKDHGPQVAVGMQDVEENIAKYVRRHFKLSTIERQIAPLGFRRFAAIMDESGLENIKGLGLYADNALWTRVSG